jgi:hypothetical protein
MKITSLLICFFISFYAISCGANQNLNGNKLVLLQGRILNAYYNGKYKEVERANIIYGYGWLDQNRIFVAYQKPNTAEAVAILEVININTNEKVKIRTIGGAGESHFDVNADTNKVVYNDSKGIHILNIKDDNSFDIDDVKETSNSWGVFWIDDQTIGTFVFEGDQQKFKKIKTQN